MNALQERLVSRCLSRQSQSGLILACLGEIPYWIDALASSFAEDGEAVIPKIFGRYSSGVRV